MGKRLANSAMRSVVTLNDDRRVAISIDARQETLCLNEEQRWFSKRPLQLSYALSELEDVGLNGRELFLHLKDKIELRLKCTTQKEAEAWHEALRRTKQSPRPDEYSCVSTIPSITSLASSNGQLALNSARALSVTSIRSSYTTNGNQDDESVLSILSPNNGEDGDGDDMVTAFSDSEIDTPVSIFPRVQNKVKPICTSADVVVNDDFVRGSSSQSRNPRLIIPAVECPLDHNADSVGDLGCTKLCEFLFIGGRAIASDRQGLKRFGITHVVNMAVECSNFFACSHAHPQQEMQDHGSTKSLNNKDDIQEKLIYLNCPCTDKSGDDMSPHLDTITSFIHEARTHNGKVLVHCNSGISRSSAAVLAYLVRYGLDGSGFSLIDAMRWLKDKRRIASPHPTYMCQLCQYEVDLRGGQSTLNASTYSNNRYEDVDKLHSSLADPRSTAQLLGQTRSGDSTRFNEQLSPVFYFSKNFSPLTPGSTGLKFPAASPSSRNSCSNPNRPLSSRGVSRNASSPSKKFYLDGQ